MIANLKRYAMRNIKLKPMAQQTAVEWLITQVNSEQYQIAFGQTYISIDLIEQAKQIEKEQMIELTQTLTSTPSNISRDTATFIVENFINR
jgi:hypothetical protein